MTTTITDLEVIDVYQEHDDDPEADNGVAIIVRADPNDIRGLYGRTITITVTT